MRSFLVAASLLSLLLPAMVGRTVAETSTCAILWRDGVSPVRAGVTLQSLPAAPVALVPAFPRSPQRQKSTPGVATAELTRWFLAQFDNSAQRDAALERLQQHPDVEFVEVVRQIALPESRQSTAASTPWNVQQVGAPAALLEVTPDSTIIVAVVDTGADLTHPDLQAQLWDSGDAPGNASLADDHIDQNGDGTVETWEKHDDDNNGYVDDQHGYDFTDAPDQGGVGDDRDRDPDPTDDHGHGTHVAGIIAARGALEGVSPFVQLMAVRAAFSTGFGGGVLETDDAAAAILYAVDNGAAVLNLSWGDTVESRLIRASIDFAVQQGVVVVAAAGNAASEGAHWPAADPRVIGVGSAMRSGQRSSFSNYGVGMDLLAPGEEATSPGAGILSLEPRSLVPAGSGERRGTSMAAPHVAGVAAIVLSRDDRPDAAMVRALLLESASRDAVDWTADRGHGGVDALAAVRSPQQLVLLWNGPTQPLQNGHLQARVSVWGADLLHFQIEAQHVDSGHTEILRPWEGKQYWNELLVDTPFATTRQDRWDLVLRAESIDGSQRQRRMRFLVDDSAAEIETLFVQAAWQGRDPQWLLSASLDEPVALHVGRDTTTVFSDAGFAEQQLLQSPADASLAGTWSIELTNRSGLLREVTQASPVVLPTWEDAAYLRPLDQTTAFLPESAWGQTPAGRLIVWGHGLEAGIRTTVQAWVVEQGVLQQVYDSSRSGRAVAYGDINADGRADLLLQDGFHAEWLLTCDTCEFPEQSLSRVSTERVLGFFQLDSDAALETILSSRDSLFLYDDATEGLPQLMQSIVNPSQQGFNFWGADAAAGDLDGDGSIELVCGDGEGMVSIFEAAAGQPYLLQQLLDTNGSYAYDVSALPPRGFIIGRQRTRSVTGDGFATTLFEFLHYQHDGSAFTVADSWPLITPTGELSAESAHVATANPLLTLVRGSDLYILERQQNVWQATTWLGGGDGVAPIVADFEGDATQRLLLRTTDGATLFDMPTVRAPHDLTSESLGAGRLQLTWEPGDAADFRVQRRLIGQAWQEVAQTTVTTWIDSTLPPYIDHEYEVQMLVATQVVATSKRIVARSQPRPRLQSLEVAGPASLRCRFTNAIDPSLIRPRFFEVRSADGRRNLILQANAHEQGRVVELVLANEPACDSLQVLVKDLRDKQNGLLEPQQTATTIDWQCAAPTFLVRQVVAEAAGFRIAFSAEPGNAAMLPASYRVYWDGQLQPIAAVQSQSATAIRLTMQHELVGRGIPYEVHVDATLLSVDGARLQLPAAPYQVLWSGQGAKALFVYPNPVRPGSNEVVFAEAAADTRVRIYNLEGDLVQTLQEVRGGALRWDLRTPGGSRVSSGTYLYIATDSTGRASGPIVVIR